MDTRAWWLGLALVWAGDVWASQLPQGFSAISEVSALVVEDMRYATADNFTGRVVPGYSAGRCWLLRPAAEALAKVAETARKQGLRLAVHDCYRPARATAAFVQWAQDIQDQSTKAIYYPNAAKSALFAEGYIGRYSAHSTGSAVDLSLRRIDGTALEFGTPFDFFDPRSATAAHVSPEARGNRQKLKALMESGGFKNYTREWWHFGFPAPGAKAFDVPIE